MLSRIDERLVLSVSATTRDPRPSEVEGVDYFFVDEDEFDRMIADGELLEWAPIVGHRSGTPRSYVEQQQRAGNDVLLEIDVKGAEQVRTLVPDAVLIFLEPPSMEELERRLRGRGTESEERIAIRLETAGREMGQRGWFDHVVVAVCASAMTTVALGTRRRAASTIADEMSTPTVSAPAATAALSNVPDPHPTSSTRRAEPRSAAPSIAAVNGAKPASKIRSLRTHPSPPVAQSSRIASFAMLGQPPIVTSDALRWITLTRRDLRYCMRQPDGDRWTAHVHLVDAHLQGVGDESSYAQDPRRRHRPGSVMCTITAATVRTTHGISTQVAAERRSASYPLSHVPSLGSDAQGTLPPSPSADMIRDT